MYIYNTQKFQSSAMGDVSPHAHYHCFHKASRNLMLNCCVTVKKIQNQSIKGALCIKRLVPPFNQSPDKAMHLTSCVFPYCPSVFGSSKLYNLIAYDWLCISRWS